MEEQPGLGGEEIGGCSRGREPVSEHRIEERRIGLGDHRRVDEDALRQRSVLLETEPASQARMADEPDREVVAAVEVEAAQPGQFVQKVVAEALSLVEDDDRDDAVLVDEETRAALMSLTIWARGLGLRPSSAASIR